MCVICNLVILFLCSWRRMFKSKLFNAMTSYANLYFTIFIAILVILFLGKICLWSCQVLWLLYVEQVCYSVVNSPIILDIRNRHLGCSRGIYGGRSWGIIAKAGWDSQRLRQMRQDQCQGRQLEMEARHLIWKISEHWLIGKLQMKTQKLQN